ncbi:MAG: hypothetical protein ACRCSN_10325, partial [Dermatophilaceae bacterium]
MTRQPRPGSASATGAAQTETSSAGASPIGASSSDASSVGAPPGYDLARRLVLTRADQVKALAHPVRTVILGLLAEREASVA